MININTNSIDLILINNKENNNVNKELYRVLKPGGYLFGIDKPHKSHNSVCDIEDIGFIIKDSISYFFKENEDVKQDVICLAMKPLSEKTFAENVMKWGTGGLNIEKSRIKQDDGNLQQKILDFSKICSVGDDIHLLSLCSFDEFSSSSLLVCQDYLKRTSSVLATYSNFYKDLLHNEVLLGGKTYTQYLGESCDYGHFVRRAVQYVGGFQGFEDFLNDYPILRHLYDELLHFDVILDQDVVPLLNDVLACIHRFLDLQENNLDYNILRLVSFLVVGFSIKTHLLNNYFLHYIQSTCKSQENIGRFPANFIISEDVAPVLDKQSGYSKSIRLENGANRKSQTEVVINPCGWKESKRTKKTEGYNDEGGASRFFKNVDSYKELLKYIAIMGLPPKKGKVLFIGFNNADEIIKEINNENGTSYEVVGGMN